MTLLRGVIGVVLRRARARQGKTLRDVADDARVSMQYLSEIERGRKEASSEVLAAICTALGWTIVDLLDAVRFELAGARVSQIEVAQIELAGTAPSVAGFGRDIAPSASSPVCLAA
jgi:transcriptional regulator with XRE-family HTH domain